MAGSLKRTFHGCLTCRKRKVRCRGGSPCANCSHMNITCHSSFDTNLRVSIATPSSGTTEKSPRTVPWNPDPASNTRLSAPLPGHPGGTGDAPVPFTPEPGLGINTFNSGLSPYMTPPPTYDAMGNILFTGQNDFNYLSGFDFDFSVLPYSLNPFHQQPGLQDVSLDSAPLLPHLEQDSARDIINPSSLTTCGLNQYATREWSPRPRRRKRNKTQTMYDDSFFLQHYGNCIAGAFTIKLDGGRWSYHRFIHDTIQNSPADDPFRLAVLAWTARQFSTSGSASVAPPPPDDVWQAYSAGAEASVSVLMASGDDWTLPAQHASTRPGPVVITIAETLIFATLFLCRTDVLDGSVAGATARLASLARELAKPQHKESLNLSAFASKALIWLCYLDVRIHLFCVTPPLASAPEDRRIGSPRETLLDVVSKRSDYATILVRSYGYLADIFGPAYPAADVAEDAARIPASLRLHDVFLLMSAIIGFRAQPDEASQPDSLYAGRAIDVEICRLEAEFAAATARDPEAAMLREMAVSRPAPPRPTDTAPPSSLDRKRPVTSDANAGVIARGRRGSTAKPAQPSADAPSRGTLHWLTSYVAFQTAKILWVRTKHPDDLPGTPHMPTSPPEATGGTEGAVDPSAAVQSIMSAALRLRRAGCSPTRILRSLLWPLPLFVAGIETADEVHADWVADFVSEVMGAGGGGQSGGAGGARLLELMARVRERQHVLRRRVDVGEVVREMGGDKGAFVF